MVSLALITAINNLEGCKITHLGYDANEVMKRLTEM